MKSLCVLAVIAAFGLSGCGVHGFTSVYNQERKTTNVLEQILHKITYQIQLAERKLTP